MTYEYKVPRTPPVGSANVVSGTDSDDISRALKTDANGRLEVILGAAGAAASPNKVEDTASASGDTGVAIMAIQKATAADLATDDDYAFAQMKDGRIYTRNMREPLGAAAEAVTPVVTSALATSKIIKASAGNLHGFNGYAAVAGFFCLINATSAVANAGALAPLRVYPVAAGQGIDVTFDPPLRFGTGITAMFTTNASPFVQTDSANAFMAGDAV